MNELVTYKSSLCSLKNLLGLGCIHILQKEEFMPYITRILETLNSWLVLEDKESQAEVVKLFVGYYEDGLEKIALGETGVEELLADYDYSSLDPDLDIPCFLVSWTNVFSTIYLELLYNYPELFTTSPVDCHECCGTISEDSNGGLVYLPGTGNLSSSYIQCGCSKS